MADQKLTALTEDTALVADDLVYVVIDTAGTPAPRKVKVANLPGWATAPAITVTGSFTVVPLFLLQPQAAVIFGGATYSASGSWLNTNSDALDCTGITAISFDNVVGFIETFYSNTDNITDFECPLLEIVIGDFNPYLPSCTTLDIGNLRAVFGDIDLSDMDVTTLDASALTTVTANGGSPVGFRINNSSTLTSIDVSALEHVGNKEWSFYDCSSLTSVNIGTSLTYVGADMYFTGNALDQTSVDAILVALAALDGTGGTTSYDNHTVDLSGGTNSAPSGTGTTAAGVLTGRGCTVTTN